MLCGNNRWIEDGANSVGGGDLRDDLADVGVDVEALWSFGGKEGDDAGK